MKGKKREGEGEDIQEEGREDEGIENWPGEEKLKE